MHAHVMARLSIVAMATLAISTDMATPTTDQSGPVASDTCRIVRMQPAGMLMTCPPRLRSIWLTMDALNRTLRFTPDGVFHFTSPIMEMCSQQPDIYGWIITKENWQSSSQDGSAIAEILQQPPAVRGPNDRAANAIPKSLDSVCGTFLLDVAGMSGRGACYKDETSATIAVIASARELGFAILFRQSDPDWESLLGKVKDVVPRFKLERSDGDIELMKWLAK